MTQIEAEAPLLEISDLSVGFGPAGQETLAVDGVSLSLLVFIGEGLRDAFDPRKGFS